MKTYNISVQLKIPYNEFISLKIKALSKKEAVNKLEDALQLMIDKHEKLLNIK